jgi:hypothetical protein
VNSPTEPANVLPRLENITGGQPGWKKVSLADLNRSGRRRRQRAAL